MAVKPEEVPGKGQTEQRRLSDLAEEFLERRGVTVVEIAAIVYDLQKPYIANLTLELCMEAVHRVLDKREVQNAIFTGVTLDMLAECGLLEEPLQSIISSDDSLYGIDEVMALSIVNIYGSIGFTNFGYLDKVKPGVIGLANGGGLNCPRTTYGQGSGEFSNPGTGLFKRRALRAAGDESAKLTSKLKSNPVSTDGEVGMPQVNTFLDDIISAIAAAAAARIAHQSRDGRLTC